jgi:hypothetical protein
MSFIPPKTFAVNEVLTAVDLNVFVRDNTNDLDSRLDEINGPFSFRYAGSRIYTTTGTFDRNDAFGNGIDTSWLRYVRGRMVAGGGSGSPGSSTQSKSVGGGGGSGAYVEFFYPYSFLLDNGDVEVGSGGIGPATGTGGTGGATRFELSFGFLTVNGGLGGFEGIISQTTDNRGARGGDGGNVTGTAAGFLGFSPYRFANGWRGSPGNNAWSVVHAGDTSYVTAHGADSMLGQGGLGLRDKELPVSYRDGGGYGWGGGGGFEAVIPGHTGGSGVVLLDFFR